MRRQTLAIGILFLLAAPSFAGPKVGIVVGPEAPKLERFAAEELAGQFKSLFGAESAVAEKVPDGVDHLVLVGSPATNPAVKEAMADGWPKLSEQGHLVKSAKLGDRPVLVVGGGSPAATLWAAYELGHHFGIRSFLHGDVMPEKVPELKLDGINITLEPAVKSRGLVVLDGTHFGFGAWGLDDHKRLFAQLAKLKFNEVAIRVNPKSPALPLGGRRFAVAGDTPGRKAFKGAKEFGNPALAGKDSDDDRKAALVELAEALREVAPEFGLGVGDPGRTKVSLTAGGMLPAIGGKTGEPAGFTLTLQVPGDLNPELYFLSRRAFEPKLTAKEAHTRLFTPILGPAATERVLLGFELIGKANVLIAENDPRSTVLNSYSIATQLKNKDGTGRPPEWWSQAAKLYTEAMNEMYRGIRAAFNDPARPMLLYYAKRCEFALHYFTALEAAYLASAAKANGDTDAAVTHLEKAIESIYNGLTALGDVARDPSDRAVIAVLTEDTYRPLNVALKEADKAAK